MQKILSLLFRLIAAIPLPVLHRIGNAAGSLAYRTQPKLRARIRDNIQSARIIADNTEADTLIEAVCRETMKGGLELAVAWVRPSEEIADLFQTVHGWEYVQTAMAEGKGLLLITPHLGSYDLAGRYISQQLPFPLTAMYRPPKIEALGEIMNAGRVRDNGRTAPANMQGVKQVIKALRSGEATIVLPDQVPGGGDGIWVQFFDREAYTMTLAARLALQTGATVLLVRCEREPMGRGFVMYAEPLPQPLDADLETAVRQVNEAMEHVIRQCPGQYLWGYGRYKQPRADAPAVEASS